MKPRLRRINGLFGAAFLQESGKCTFSLMRKPDTDVAHLHILEETHSLQRFEEEGMPGWSRRYQS